MNCEGGREKICEYSWPTVALGGRAAKKDMDAAGTSHSYEHLFKTPQQQGPKATVDPRLTVIHSAQMGAGPKVKDRKERPQSLRSENSLSLGINCGHNSQ